LYIAFVGVEVVVGLFGHGEGEYHEEWSHEGEEESNSEYFYELCECGDEEEHVEEEFELIEEYFGEEGQ
jgi:hypothetical protein